tara:strand:+ start:1159 stop:2706 length:1548 start_codon:yes stop_codon:yes gene_type:complete
LPSYLEFGDAAVAAGSQLAAEAAANCMRDGGNAVDAAVVASAVQCVVEPGHCGLGGDLFALVHSSEEGTWALNGSGRVPGGIVAALDGEVAPRFGPLSVSVPGTPASWGLLLDRFGTIGLDRALAPAIECCEDGFPVYGSLSEMIVRVGDALEDGSSLSQLFSGNPSDIGGLFKQPALGSTLRHLANNGVREFYTGGVGKGIVGDCQSQGGVLALEDMESCEFEFVEPLMTHVGNAQVYTQPPVSMGLVFIMELMLLEKLGAYSESSSLADDIDTLVRCKHAAFADGIPALQNGVPNEWLEKAVDTIFESDIQGSTWESTGGDDTTCTVVADGQGMVVSVIHSLFNEFGSRVLLPTSGVILNDRLANNMIGKNGLKGGDRAIHTLHSYLLMEDGIPRVMGCTPGGRGQVQINFQIVSNILLRGLSIKDALEQPRWLSGNPRLPYPKDTLFLEHEIPSEVVEPLESKGHLVHHWDDSATSMFGSCVLAGFDRDQSRWYGIADGRRDAKVCVLNGGT